MVHPVLPAMDIVDREISRAERDASPERFPPATLAEKLDEKRIAESRRSSSSSSTSSGSSSSSSSHPTRHESIAVSRATTQRDLERHPTEIDRIHTHRSQHIGTVGRTTTSRKSKGPLPDFGAGKPYPPPLPEQEEYVVEFSGPDDPMHPQNWPMRKK